MINIDLDNMNEEVVYKAFSVDGNESEALNDSYLELFELIGRDTMLKLFKYFRGDKIDCPMKLYRPKALFTGASAFTALAVVGNAVSLNQPNKDTIAAMLEAERIAKDPSVKGYTDLNQLFADLKE